MSLPIRLSILLPLILLSLPVSPIPAGAALAPFGTPSLVADLTPGPEGSSFRLFLPTPNGAIFLLESESSGTPDQLWATDGTPDGTFRLAPDRLRLPIRPTIRYTERYVYFDGIDVTSGVRGIWRTDGTAEGTIELVEGPAFSNQADSLGDDGTLLFVAEEPVGSPEPLDFGLWVSDGTPEGTVRLRGYGLLPNSGYAGFDEYDGAVYFLDLTPTDETAIGLWRTDGTAAGTEFVTVPATGGVFQQIWPTTSALYLRARSSPDSALSLWTSDGTAAGTRQIMPLEVPDNVSRPLDLIGELDATRTLWTFSTPSVAPSVWVSDGTQNGTRQILDVSASDLGTLGVGGLTGLFEGFNYFVADDGASGREIWKTDGTPAGTEVAYESAPGTDSDLAGFDSLGDRLYLALRNPTLGTEPSITAPSFEEIELLGDLCPGPCSSSPIRFTRVGDRFVFLARDPSSRFQPWSTNLTAAGTEQIDDFPGGVTTDPPTQPLTLADRVLLVADDGVTGAELWALPITGGDPLPPAGPWLSSDLVPGFEYKVRITGGAGPIAGSLEPTCIPETACVSGAVPGRSEVFVRVVGPRPNGYLWPTLVKFSTSEVEVWIRQLSTGVVRYYRLEGARPGVDELPGLFDRMGFEP